MKKLLICALLIAGLSACAYDRTPLVNYADITKVDFSNASSFKEGSDCATTILWFGPFGSQNVIKAAKDGNISKVEVVDYELNNYILFGRGCVIAYGK